MRLRKRNTKQISIPGDEDGAWIKIKALSVADVKRIDSIVNDISMSSGSTGPETKVTFDPYQRTLLLAQACLVDWFGLYDENDEEIKFSEVNFDKVESFEVEIDGTFIDFYTWVDGQRAKFEEELRVQKEKAEKNS